MEVYIQLFINSILKGGVYGILSIGLTIVYGVARILNFAHGEFVMLAMYSAYFIFSIFGLTTFAGVFINIPLFFIVGILAYKIVFKRITGAGGYTQIFTTLGASMIIQSIMLLLFGSTPKVVNLAGMNISLQIGPYRASLIEVFGFVLSTVMMFVLFAFLQYTHNGKSIRAVIDQRRGAMLVGINVDAMYQLAIAIGFACVGASGSIIVSMYQATPSAGETWGLLSLAIVVLGGYGSLPGSVLAAMLIGLVEAFSGFFFSTQLKEVAYFVLFLLVLFFRPRGLFGKKTA